MWGAFLAVAVLLSVNAFFVAAEFAAVGVRPARVRALADTGRRSAARLDRIIGDGRLLDRHIATCQIGITLSSLLLGAYGQLAFTRDLASILPGASLPLAAAIVLIVLSVAQVLLGELVPKSLALQFPVRTALATTAVTDWARRAFTPLIWLLNGSAWGLLRAMRVRPSGHRHVHSPEELEIMVAESGREGVLDPDEHQRLRGALRLRSVTAADVRVPREEVFTVDADQDVRAVLARVLEAPHTRVPVVRDGDIVGILHTKDLLDASGTVADVMRSIPVVAPGLSADRVISTLRRARTQMAAVGDGGHMGVVTFEDVLADVLGAGVQRG